MQHKLYSVNVMGRSWITRKMNQPNNTNIPHIYIESTTSTIVNPMASTPTDSIHMESSSSTIFHPLSLTNGRSGADDSLGPPRSSPTEIIHINRKFISSTCIHPFTANSMGATILKSFRRRLCIRRSIVAATFFKSFNNRIGCTFTSLFDQLNNDQFELSFNRWFALQRRATLCLFVSGIVAAGFKAAPNSAHVGASSHSAFREKKIMRLGTWRLYAFAIVRWYWRNLEVHVAKP